MALVFNADEILTMAQEIERSGAAFYRQAAEIVPGAKLLLLKIAEQEEKHLSTFQAMQQIVRGDRNAVAEDADDAAAMYIKAFADRRVFVADHGAEVCFRGGETLEQVGAIAIDKEKDSIVFYVGMKQLVPFALGRDQIDAIISEEMRHIAWIEKTVLKGSVGG